MRLIDTPAGELLYLDRYYRDEQTIRAILAERESSRPAVDPGAIAAILDELFTQEGHPAAPPDRQRIAAALVATEWTTILTGGPGTGKTHTVARILALLHRLHGPGLRVGVVRADGESGRDADRRGRRAGRRSRPARGAGRLDAASAARRAPRQQTGMSSMPATVCRMTSSWWTSRRWCR